MLKLAAALEDIVEARRGLVNVGDDLEVGVIWVGEALISEVFLERLSLCDSPSVLLGTTQLWQRQSNSLVFLESEDWPRE
jgi:hypothetical protein